MSSLLRAGPRLGTVGIAVNALDERRTDRLLLTRMRDDDLDDLCRMHRDPQVMATLGGVRSDETTAKFLPGAMSHWEGHGVGFWTVRAGATVRSAGVSPVSSFRTSVAARSRRISRRAG